jgi:hypothetical protein
MINPANGGDAEYRFRRGLRTLYHRENECHAKPSVNTSDAMTAQNSNHKAAGSDA